MFALMFSHLLHLLIQRKSWQKNGKTKILCFEKKDKTMRNQKPRESLV